MKKYLLTGVVIMLPVALTLIIVVYIFNLLTEPFVGFFKSMLDYYGLLSNGFLFWSASQVQIYLSRLIILALLFLLTTGLGWIARWFFITYLLLFWDRVLQRIPFIRSVYKTCQEVIQTLFKTTSSSFKQVVMVPFPAPETLVLGLVARDNFTPLKERSDELATVFIPTTPNPTSGFLVMYEKKDLIYLDMKAEEAMKYVISCGMVSSPFTMASIPQFRQRLEKPPSLL